MHSNKSGFTLIEVLITVFIVAVISAIAYSTISGLINAKQVIDQTNSKWGGLTNALDLITNDINACIPLAVRDNSGNYIPALIGLDSVKTNSDSNLELTVAGFIGDNNYGVTPPRRFGFRYFNHGLYLVSYPVLNRVVNTRPNVELLVNGIKMLQFSFLWPDGTWRSAWPMNANMLTNMPIAIKLDLVLDSGEKITRQWSLGITSVWQ